MGLAAPKNRSKISNDPQNTNWSTNTDRFGHRLLISQGWAPGSSLGAKNASHASHYTAASHSHVRVFLKEDNLGLGAKLGSERPENFGLAGLESVLGRLNGKEEEVKIKQEEKKEVQIRAWVSSRYGGMNFVSGGFLVGGDIVSKKDLKAVEEKEAKAKAKTEEGKKEKKRKRVKDEDSEIKLEDIDDEEPKLKRKKKSMDLRAEALLQDAAQSDSSAQKSKKDKKEKKSKKSSSEPETAVAASPSTTTLSDKALRKAEKRARKEEKKLKKALKRAAKDAAKSQSAPDTPAESSSSEDETTDSPASSIPTTGTSTPITAAGLTFGAGGRHAVRQRYIRQKKMASMDPQALKEIFMIKT